MKTLVLSLLLLVLLFGCKETSVEPIENENPESHSYDLIELPPRPAGGTQFTQTETIDGNKGGQIAIHEQYVTEDGDTVKIDAKLKIEKDCFSGTVDITMTIDDIYTAVLFSPPMVFDNPLELDLAYKGLDPDQLILPSGNYEFLYIDDNGNTELIESFGVEVKEQSGQISVKKAMLNHFSRFAFAR